MKTYDIVIQKKCLAEAFLMSTNIIIMVSCRAKKNIFPNTPSYLELCYPTCPKIFISLFFSA